jgi:hypothetical protein
LLSLALIVLELRRKKNVAGIHILNVPRNAVVDVIGGTVPEEEMKWKIKSV